MSQEREHGMALRDIGALLLDFQYFLEDENLVFFVLKEFPMIQVMETSYYGE